MFTYKSIFAWNIFILLLVETFVDRDQIWYFLFQKFPEEFRGQWKPAKGQSRQQTLKSERSHLISNNNNNKNISFTDNKRTQFEINYHEKEGYFLTEFVITKIVEHQHPNKGIVKVLNKLWRLSRVGWLTQSIWVKRNH